MENDNPEFNTLRQNYILKIREHEGFRKSVYLTEIYPLLEKVYRTLEDAEVGLAALKKANATHSQDLCYIQEIYV